MALSEKDYLTQVGAAFATIANLSRQFATANPDSEFEDFAEEQLEDAAGDAALVAFWLANWPSTETGEAAVAARRKMF